MTYRPQEFWEQRLSEQFDLRGTGQPGLSLAFNRACYRQRRGVLDRALAESGIDPKGRRVLDVGCGTGFFTEYYLGRGAAVLGIDIAPTSIARLTERFPQARFLGADVSELALEERFDIVNAFDVLYHITDDDRWAAAVERLGLAVAPGGILLVTDVFAERSGLEEHNQARSLTRYLRILDRAGVEYGRTYPTHFLLNRELGFFRFLNRLPWLLYGLDGGLLRLGYGGDPKTNKLLVARRVE